MTSQLRSWFRQRSPSAHTFVVAYGLCSSYLLWDNETRVLLSGFVRHHLWLTILINVAVFAYARYAPSLTTQGHLVTLGETPHPAVVSAVQEINVEDIPKTPALAKLGETIVKTAAKI